MSESLHVGIWFNPFAIRLNKLANILHIMYRLLHSVKSKNSYLKNLSLLYTAKMYSKNYECVIMQVTKAVLISA